MGENSAYWSGSKVAHIRTEGLFPWYMDIWDLPGRKMWIPGFETVWMCCSANNGLHFLLLDLIYWLHFKSEKTCMSEIWNIEFNNNTFFGNNKIWARCCYTEIFTTQSKSMVWYFQKLLYCNIFFCWICKSPYFAQLSFNHRPSIIEYICVLACHSSKTQTHLICPPRKSRVTVVD